MLRYARFQLAKILLFPLFKYQIKLNIKKFNI